MTPAEYLNNLGYEFTVTEMLDYYGNEICRQTFKSWINPRPNKDEPYRPKMARLMADNYARLNK